MDMHRRPSPNHDARAGDGQVYMLILHYTGMRTRDEALDRMCDPQAKVSAHYMIDEDGAVFALVAEDRRAWHAGEAFWDGQTDINGRSIGIELVNPGHEFGYRAFPDAQIDALEILARDILGRHPVQPRYVLGHSDVAPSRRTDPGELFEWPRLGAAGIGLWPFSSAATGMTAGPVMEPGSQGEHVAAAQNLLFRFGYRITVDGIVGENTATVVRAFQRHFRPAAVTGNIDLETAQRLTELTRVIF